MIVIDIGALDQYCKNKKLLKLIFCDFIKTENLLRFDKYKEAQMIDNENQNLLRPEMLQIFKNVWSLQILCDSYPLSLRALLKLINNTNIREVWICATDWVRLLKSWPSFADIKSEYDSANFNMRFEAQDKILAITCNL